MLTHFPRRSLLPLSMIAAGLLCGACVQQFPALDEQKTQVQRGHLLVHQLSSQAVLAVWGPPTYERREYTQFFTLSSGSYVPFFRVPLGEAPVGWDNGVIPGEGLFLAYPERGELLGFLNDRLVYRERLPVEELHTLGKSWDKESRLKTPLEKSLSPR